MPELMESALAAAQALEDTDDDDLYRELGLRITAIQRDPTIAGQFAPPRSMVEPMGIALSDMLDVGRRAFAQISKAANALVCSGLASGNFDAFIATLGKDRITACAALTAVLGGVGFAPVIAGVVAALAIGKVVPATVDAFCAGWAKKADIPAPTTPTTPPAPTAPPAPPAPAPA
jgi:hypothetical protein